MVNSACFRSVESPACDWMVSGSPVPAESAAPTSPRIDDSAVALWNELRLFFATQTFQTLVRATGDDIPSIIRMRDDDPIRRDSAPDPGSYYVRTTSFAPTLGRFAPRDAI